jgi:hypothetical protein
MKSAGVLLKLRMDGKESFEEVVKLAGRVV